MTPTKDTCTSLSIVNTKWNTIHPTKGALWMNQEDVVLGELSQAQEEKHCTILPISGIYIRGKGTRQAGLRLKQWLWGQVEGGERRRCQRVDSLELFLQHEDNSVQH
jgi:hypothetical protein